MVAHNPQENGVFNDFKRQTIEIIDSHFPYIICALYFFRMQGWMLEVF